MPEQRGDLTLIATAGETGRLTAPGGVVGALTADTISEATAAAGVTVDGCLIKDGRAANLAVAAIFKSDEQTGDGTAQSIAHGFGAVPTLVLVVPTELPADLTGGYDAAEGTHTSTNVLVTVTTGCKYRVIAIR